MNNLGHQMLDFQAFKCCEYDYFAVKADFHAADTRINKLLRLFA